MQSSLAISLLSLDCFLSYGYGYGPTKSCPSSYKYVAGDIPGGGIRSISSVGNIADCARICKANSKCCSFEHSRKRKICNLNSECQPTAEVWQDFDFCVQEGPSESCPSSYKYVAGDIPGGGIKAMRSVGNIHDCAEHCKANANCCSFEYSRRTKRCNLNSECKPTRGVWQDYDFCVQEGPTKSCPSSYKYVAGDIPGAGIKAMSSVGNIDDCADHCKANSNCCSFEYSRKRKRCNLNSECKPTTKVWQDYDFCVKEY